MLAGFASSFTSSSLHLASSSALSSVQHVLRVAAVACGQGSPLRHAAELHLVVAASARAPPCRCSSCFASAPMLLRRCSTRCVSPSPRMQGQKGLGPYADEA